MHLFQMIYNLVLMNLDSVYFMVFIFYYFVGGCKSAYFILAYKT